MATPTDDELARSWRALLRPFGSDADAVEREVADLLRRHREPHRRYHTTEHLAEALAAVDELADEADEADDATAVRLAGWYHDAVYDPRSRTSEAQSAALAAQRLPTLGVPAEVVEDVVGLIEGTAAHRPDGDDRNARVLTDADLWILGTEPGRYQRYVADVRAEYRHLDDETWRAGRSDVLDDFLGRDRIYATDRFHRAFDERARQNLAAERSALGG
jgi:predicted metal-dependent HD superfamily phosphohydrolase